MKVRDVYRPNIATCAPDTVLQNAAQRMDCTDACIVAVVDRDRVVGVITERDMVRALAWDASPYATAVSTYATADVLTAEPDEDIDVVARRMIDAGVRRVPVVTPDGELKGMVSMRDLLAVEVLMTASNM